MHQLISFSPTNWSTVCRTHVQTSSQIAYRKSYYSPIHIQIALISAEMIGSSGKQLFHTWVEVGSSSVWLNGDVRKAHVMLVMSGLWLSTLTCHLWVVGPIYMTGRWLERLS